MFISVLPHRGHAWFGMFSTLRYSPNAFNSQNLIETSLGRIMPAGFVSFLDLEFDASASRFSRIIFTGNCSFAMKSTLSGSRNPE